MLTIQKSIIATTISLLLASCSFQQNTPTDPSSDTLLSLVNFDNDSPIVNSQSQNSQVELVQTQGLTGKALSIHFSADATEASISLEPQKNWNWSQYNEFNLALDAKNPGEESIQLFIDIINKSGNSSNFNLNLAAGTTDTYYLLLKGNVNNTDLGFKNSKMAAWASNDKIGQFRNGSINMDFSQVSAIRLSIRGNLKDKNVIVDNLRLRANPSYSDDYRKGFVDAFGQNAKQEFPIKVHSTQELKNVADKELAHLAASGSLPDRSRFGGWKDGPKLTGSGYFTTHKMNGKWWLVDPEGYLFFSNGLANVRMANLTTLTGIDFKDDAVRYVDPEAVTPEDSMGIVQVSEKVRESRYVASVVRHDMFNWLPDYDDPLAKHYSYRRSVHMGPLKSGETYSFYRANLERRYGESSPDSFEKKWQQVTLDRFNDWGFTSMGNWVDPAFYANKQVPYFANGWIIGDFKTLKSPHDIWAPMPDAYDPEFVRRTQITVDTIAGEIQSSPWCVGIFIDNEKSWGRPEGTVEHRYGLIIDALSKDSKDSPAKAAFNQAMQEKYGDINSLNQAWAANLTSWQAFAKGWTTKYYSPALMEDLSIMLSMLSEQYFRVVHEALEQTLPQHLYMGARMAGWGMPKETVQAAVKYSDVLSFNIYEEGVQAKEWGFLTELDLPTIIGEFHIGATSDTGLLHPGLVSAANQKDRAHMYQQYMQSVANHPNMVGAHWFQYVDSPITGRAFDGENYNVGFVSTTDIPYPELVNAAREFNRTLYPQRFNH